MLLTVEYWVHVNISSVSWALQYWLIVVWTPLRQHNGHGRAVEWYELPHLAKTVTVPSLKIREVHQTCSSAMGLWSSALIGSLSCNNATNIVHNAAMQFEAGDCLLKKTHKKHAYWGSPPRLNLSFFFKWSVCFTNRPACNHVYTVSSK